MMNELGHVANSCGIPSSRWQASRRNRRFSGGTVSMGIGASPSGGSGTTAASRGCRASRLPELLLYHPFGLDESTGEPLPTHVRTPAGTHVELRGAELPRRSPSASGAAWS